MAYFLDCALIALNGARQTLRPEFYPIHYDAQARRVCVRRTRRGSSPTSDLNRVCYATERAAETLNETLRGDPSLHLALDDEDRWVVVRWMA